MKIFKQLSKKGYKHYYEGTIEELDSMDKDNQHLHSEIMQVIMWLYEKHGIWINGGLYAHLGNVSKFQFTIQSQKSKSTNSIVQLNINPFNSPTEAYEAAIEYTLKNLL